MPKIVSIKKMPITFRLMPGTIDRLKSIEKYHSKVDKFINLGIDFENILNLSSEDMSLNLHEYRKHNKDSVKVNFCFDKTDKYIKEMIAGYDEETIKLLNIFYYIAFSDRNN